MAHNISKKQAGVIYRNWKQGNLTATKETINLVYSYAEYFVSTDSKADNLVTILRGCVEAIFANEMEKAQEELDLFERIHNLYYVAV